MIVETLSRYSPKIGGQTGIIAQEVIDNVFVVNRASYRVEFLKINSDEPAVPGELSRVILTDLYNYAMPMIRYDTGDLAIFEHHPKYGKVITSIEGRVRDFIYDTKGNLLSPSAITVHMWQFDNIEQFQFVQETEKRYVLKLNVVADFYDEDKLVTLIKEVVGHDAEVLLEYVDGIPRLRSGKSRQVVCNYKPSI